MATALGRTVRELDSVLTSSDLTEAIAYYELEPYGAWRDNFHAAVLAATINPKANLDSFFYRSAEAVRESRLDQMKAKFMQMFHAAKPKE